MQYFWFGYTCKSNLILFLLPVFKYFHFVFNCCFDHKHYLCWAISLKDCRFLCWEHGLQSILEAAYSRGSNLHKHWALTNAAPHYSHKPLLVSGIWVKAGICSILSYQSHLFMASDPGTQTHFQIAEEARTLPFCCWNCLKVEMRP